MKKIKHLLFILLACVMIPTYSQAISSNVMVYICVTGKVYHNRRNCKGLRNATHEIKEVSENVAFYKYGRRRCKVCYNY